MNGMQSRSARLWQQTRRSVGESWSVFWTLLPSKKGGASASSSQENWRTKFLALTQQDDNQVARTLLQLDKEVHLIRYHGIQKYLEQQQQQGGASNSLIAKWVQALSPMNLVRPYLSTPVQKGAAETSPSPNNPNTEAPSTIDVTSPSSANVVKIPFVITTVMKQELAELGYSNVEMKKMTPLDATLLLQNQVSPAQKDEQLPELIQQHQQSLQEEHQRIIDQQQQKPKEVPQPPPPPPPAQQPVEEEKQQEMHKDATSPVSSDTSSQKEEILQLEANPQAVESDESSPQEQQQSTTTQPSPATTITRSQYNDGWYRVIEVMKIPAHEDDDGSSPQQREEETVVALHRTLEEAQEDCGLRQELANRNHKARAAKESTASSPPIFQVAEPVSTT